MSLTNSDSDGRILLQYNPINEMSSFIKFIMLNPEKNFLEVATQARSIILAGGTLQPMNDFVEQLVSLPVIKKLSHDKILQFSCGHVVEKENLICIALGKGPSSKTFDFTYKARSQFETLRELGNTLINLSKVVPEGMVCFFPSYHYEELVFKYC